MTEKLYWVLKGENLGFKKLQDFSEQTDDLSVFLDGICLL
jgi:hypothetical protein